MHVMQANFQVLPYWFGFTRLMALKYTYPRGPFPAIWLDLEVQFGVTQ